MMTNAPVPRIIVYDLASVATVDPSRQSPEHKAWVERHLASSRIYFEKDAGEFPALHPLFSRVAGFASASLVASAEKFRLEDVRVVVGAEGQCLAAASRALSAPGICRLDYSPMSWATRYLIERMLAGVATGELRRPELSARSIDLADTISLGGLVGVPPLHLALEALGLGRIPRPLAAAAVHQLMKSGEHRGICEQLVAHLWATAAIYLRVYAGPGRVLEKVVMPTATGDSTDGATPPSFES